MRGYNAVTTTIVTDLEEVLDLSPITFEREREFATVQGQAWQVVLTNIQAADTVRACAGGWARLEVGFVEEDLWATIGVGRLQDVTVSAGGTISIEVEDLMTALVNATLPRKVRFQNTAWVSEIEMVKTDEDSSGYDNEEVGAGCEIVSGGADIADEEIFIEFTSATAFKIVLPSGNQSQTGNISSDCTFTRDGGSGSIKINKEGWSTQPDAYVAGDKFMLTTSRVREDFELGAIGMIRHLILDIAGYEVYDFDADEMVTPLYDAAGWGALVTETIDDTCFGTFDKGARIIDLIQDLLPLHIAIYPRPTGQIAVWYMLPATGAVTLLSGNHDGGDVTILNDSTAASSMASVYNRVVYKYKTRGSRNDAVYEARDPDKAFGVDLPLEVETQWEINPLSIATAAERALVRFGEVARPYALAMPFYGATIDIGDMVAITDSALGAAMDQAGVTKVSIDPLSCAAYVEAVLEKIMLENYFVIAADDESFGSRIGDEGDPGAGRIY